MSWGSIKSRFVSIYDRRVEFMLYLKREALLLTKKHGGSTVGLVRHKKVDRGKGE